MLIWLVLFHLPRAVAPQFNSSPKPQAVWVAAGFHLMCASEQLWLSFWSDKTLHKKHCSKLDTVYDVVYGMGWITPDMAGHLFKPHV